MSDFVVDPDESLVQMKKTTQMKLETNYNLAKEASENYFAYAEANPQIAEKALSIVGNEISKVYMDYLERLTRLNEQVTQRLLEVTRESLQRCKEKEEKPKRSSSKKKTTSKKTKPKHLPRRKPAIKKRVASK